MRDLRVIRVVASSGLLVLSGCGLQKQSLSRGFYVDWGGTAGQVSSEVMNFYQEESEVPLDGYSTEGQLASPTARSMASVNSIGESSLEDNERPVSAFVRSASEEPVPIDWLFNPVVAVETHNATDYSGHPDGDFSHDPDPDPDPDSAPLRWYNRIPLVLLAMICVATSCYPLLILRIVDDLRVKKGKPRMGRKGRFWFFLPWFMVYAVLMGIFIWWAYI